MGSNGLTSLLYFLGFGLFFYWMMKKGGCGMHGHGGHDHAGHGHDDLAGPDARHGDVTGSTMDPVYGMPIDPNRAVGMRAVSDRSYYFSAAYCQPKFNADPDGIAGRALAGRDHCIRPVLRAGVRTPLQLLPREGVEAHVMTSQPPTGDELRGLYRKRAPRYDLTSHVYGLLGYRLNAYRRRGTELLSLHSGDTVVEIGCGTGANLARLERAVGPSGAIIGVDMSPAMLEQARARVRREGWSNVTLVESDAARYGFPERINAIFSTYALTLVPSYDDVIRQGANALVPGGRFVVVDFKAPRSWPEPVLRVIVPLLRPFGVTLDLRMRHPWESLAKHLNLVVMEERYLGTTYIAAGERPAAAPTGNGEPRS